MAQESSDVSGVVLILVVVGFIAYAVAAMFLGVFETAIDTILVCFCWEQSAKGSFVGGHVYCTEHLNSFIEGINVEEATKKKEEGEDGRKTEAVQVKQAAAPETAGEGQ